MAGEIGPEIDRALDFRVESFVVRWRALLAHSGTETEARGQRAHTEETHKPLGSHHGGSSRERDWTPRPYNRSARQSRDIWDSWNPPRARDRSLTARHPAEHDAARARAIAGADGGVRPTSPRDRGNNASGHDQTGRKQ